MRSEPNLLIEHLRVTKIERWASPAGVNWGAFQRGALFILSSGSGGQHGAGWEHVSVSHRDRVPTWGEMQAIKELFWSDDETVVQFHPRRDQYVNCHKNVLHLWRKMGQEHELPPGYLIGPCSEPTQETVDEPV